MFHCIFMKLRLSAVVGKVGSAGHLASINSSAVRYTVSDKLVRPHTYCVRESTLWLRS